MTPSYIQIGRTKVHCRVKSGEVTVFFDHT